MPRNGTWWRMNVFVVDVGLMENLLVKGMMTRRGDAGG
jgi:hypothetical protein